MRFTIGYVRHNEEVRETYLAPSVKKLTGDFDIIGISSDFGCPAAIYNEILKQSTNRYIIFTHEDISFIPKMLADVEKTITDVKTFGVLGLVGKLEDTGKQVWSRSTILNKYRTVDCCFFVVDKSNNIKFDDTLFNGLHKYAEDYAMQCRLIGLPNYSIYSNSNSTTKEIAHHSHSCKTLGYKWGNWGQYHNVFNKKWRITNV